MPRRPPVKPVEKSPPIGHRHGDHDHDHPHDRESIDSCGTNLVVVNVTVTHRLEIPQLCEILDHLPVGGSEVLKVLTRIERKMSAFGTKLDKLEANLAAFDEREAKEDETAVLSKAEIERLKAELAALQIKVDESVATPEEEARFEAILKRIEGNNKIPDEVLPEPTPPEPEPAPPEPPV